MKEHHFSTLLHINIIFESPVVLWIFPVFIQGIKTDRSPPQGIEKIQETVRESIIFPFCYPNIRNVTFVLQLSFNKTLNTSITYPCIKHHRKESTLLQKLTKCTQFLPPIIVSKSVSNYLSVSSANHRLLPCWAWPAFSNSRQPINKKIKRAVLRESTLMCARRTLQECAASQRMEYLVEKALSLPSLP
ncbi:hypothetical protein AVEN_137810-1 [Araneus ventricosus]|uniref:Uncharacterized protein n=1 Tax=Araneus ventricosus TaxID=182803 RepID=A0A4Y2S673_ARAVE|nr:hypothetical protein AVEN_137810-1 [Araneus ventricosus]